MCLEPGHGTRTRDVLFIVVDVEPASINSFLSIKKRLPSFTPPQSTGVAACHQAIHIERLSFFIYFGLCLWLCWNATRPQAGVNLFWPARRRNAAASSPTTSSSFWTLHQRNRIPTGKASPPSSLVRCFWRVSIEGGSERIGSDYTYWNSWRIH